MDLLSLALSLSLPFGRGGFSGDYSLDLTPTFAIEAPTANWGAQAMTLPGAVLFDPRLGPLDDPDLIRHELTHADQMGALGPGFWVAYALTGGRPFEPYDPLARFLPGARPTASTHDMSATWRPEEGEMHTFPLFRLAREGGATRAQLLPGYPQLVRR